MDLRSERLVRLVDEVAGEVRDAVLRAFLELVSPLLGEVLGLLREEGSARDPCSVGAIRPRLPSGLHHVVDSVEPHGDETVQLVRDR